MALLQKGQSSKFTQYYIKYSIASDNLFLSFDGSIYQFGLRGNTFSSDDCPYKDTDTHKMDILTIDNYSACVTKVASLNNNGLGTVLCTILDIRKLKCLLTKVRPFIFNDVNNLRLMSILQITDYEITGINQKDILLNLSVEFLAKEPSKFFKNDLKRWNDCSQITIDIEYIGRYYRAMEESKLKFLIAQQNKPAPQGSK
jgi:hypothetical protein